MFAVLDSSFSGLVQDVLEKLRHNLPVTIASAIVMSLLVGFWKRLLRFAKRKLGFAEPSEKPRPRVSWPPDELARVYPAESLLRGCIVAPGTRLLVLDRGKPQFVLGPGEYGRKEIRDRFNKYALQKSAECLQYVTSSMELERTLDGLTTKDGYRDVKASLIVGILVDDGCPENLLQWHLSRDGVVEQKEVAALIDERFLPWIRSHVSERSMNDLAPAVQGWSQDLDKILNEEIFAGHGLKGVVRSVCFDSAQFQAFKDKEADLRLLNAQAELEHLTLQILGMKEINELKFRAELEQLKKDLEHEGRMKEYERLKSEVEKKQWLREHAPGELKSSLRQEQAFSDALADSMHAAQPDSEDERARQELLRRIQHLRDKSAPFALEVWLATDTPVARDIAPRPRHTHSKLRIGDKIKLRVRSARSGHLTLFNLGTSGKVTLLYPNPYHPDSRIDGDKVNEIPSDADSFDLPLLGPPGTEIVQALVTSRPVSVAENLRAEGGFRSWEPRAAARDIGVMVKELESMPDDSWSEAALSFDVT